MSKSGRREFLGKVGVATLAAGSMSKVLASSQAQAQWGRPGKFVGYGELVADANGVLDLPRGFQYRAFSSVGDGLSSGQPVPSSHDGMAAFAGLLGTYLVRNHELSPDDIEEDGLTPVALVPGHVYDPEAPGGTTTLLVRGGRLVRDEISLSGTLNNCAGGPTPWQTWLTCEEDTETLGKAHGYVFEVDPRRGGDVRPIKAMGRFEHEAVAFDFRGVAYLTEDADSPHGCFYRFIPNRRFGGRGSLHAGGSLAAMVVAGVTSDLSSVQTPGLVLPVSWVDVPNPDPGDDDTSVREQVIALGATPIQKGEGVWTGLDGSIWFVSSRGDGPNAEDEEDISAGEHAGQIWRYDPRNECIELVVIFPKGSPFDGPDNITVSPHGFALACTDGEDDQWLVGIGEEGEAMPFAFNPMNDSEFAGATFSANGDILFVNVQDPGMTFAIWGPWARGLKR
jgi:secreted PhoX family phosphatase